MFLHKSCRILAVGDVMLLNMSDTTQSDQVLSPRTGLRCARKPSTSPRVGMADCAPFRVTETEAAETANEPASRSERPAASSTENAALKQSPAAVVSTA